MFQKLEYDRQLFNGVQRFKYFKRGLKGLKQPNALILRYALNYAQFMSVNNAVR